MNIFEDMADDAESEAQKYGFTKIEAQFNQRKKFHKSYNVG